MNRRDSYTDVASSIPFDNSENFMHSEEVQSAIEEAAGVRNLEGGNPYSIYGGVFAIDGGGVIL